MALYYRYDQTIFGSNTTLNGKPIDYGQIFRIETAGKTWRYTGEVFRHIVYERDNSATVYNGDSNNERIDSTHRVGNTYEQSVTIDGEQKAVIYDYAFSVTDGIKSYEIAVIDVDLNNSTLISSDPKLAENGYYLIFVGDIPPPNTDLIIHNLTNNSSSRRHSDLGGKIVCFAAGTQIETRDGKLQVENLGVGSEVLTLDSGYQPIRWIGSKRLSAEELSYHPNLRPIRIRAGSLGKETPSHDLIVSPQHRILAKSKLVQRMFDQPEILVAAKHLLSLPGIEIAMDIESVVYWHFLFDRHHVVLSNGAPSESLFTGPEALKSVSPEARNEILTLFPELAAPDAVTSTQPARLFVQGRQGRQFAERTARNNHSVLSETPTYSPVM